ncbi:MAG: hypothetical protein ACAI34_16420 [Verrucomicrobium sp.]|nr:hypothetical protein [Verrucomicrobium sp.]
MTGRKIYQWILRIPLKIHCFFVLLTAGIIPLLTAGGKNPGEWYPFSNFPMYSSFEKQAYYVYVTDREDRPLALYPTFGNWSSGVKKIFDGYFKAEAKVLKKPSKKMTAEESRPAGDAALRQLRDTGRYPEEVKKHAGFRLYKVDISLKDGVIVKETSLVGEI